MKNASAFLTFAALVLFEALSIQTTTLALSLPSPDAIQDEKAKPPDLSKGSDKVVIKLEGLQNVREADVLEALREKGAAISKEDLKD